VTNHNWGGPEPVPAPGWPGQPQQPGYSAVPSPYPPVPPGAGVPHGTPPPGFAPPGLGPSGPWGPPPRPPGRRRKPLIITLLASLSVLVVVGVVVAIVLTTSNAANPRKLGSGSAGDVVKAYLEALAKGDADTALSLSVAQPASKKFLTNEALKQQIDHWPIKNIAIVEDSSKKDPGEMAIVRATADFGPQHSEGQIQVKKSDGLWKLASATVNIMTMSQILQGGPATTLTMLGKPLGQDATVYVFPGYLGITSVKYVDVTAPPMLLESLVGDNPTTLNVDYALNDTGREAVKAALETWINGCLTAPQNFYNCKPQRIDTPINQSTAKITGPIDLSGITQTLVPMSLSVMVTGIAHYNFTAQTVSGENASFVSTLTVANAVNLSKEPPVVGTLR
jgi:hypothetical protein